MNNTTPPTLEFCEETQDYRLITDSYPKYIKMIRDGKYQTYKEQIKYEPLVGSDGTVFVQALKVYEKIIDVPDVNNRKAHHSNAYKEEKNAQNIKEDKKSLKSNVLADKQLKASSGLNLNNVNIDAVGQTSKVNTLGIRVQPTKRLLIELSRRNLSKRKPANFEICHFKCLLKMNRSHILHLYNEFLSFNEKIRLCYLSRLIRKRLQRRNNQKKRKIIYHFFVPFNNRLIKVCKSCFKKIYFLQSDYFLKSH